MVKPPPNRFSSTDLGIENDGASAPKVALSTSQCHDITARGYSKALQPFLPRTCKQDRVKFFPAEISLPDIQVSIFVKRTTYDQPSCSRMDPIFFLFGGKIGEHLRGIGT